MQKLKKSNELILLKKKMLKNFEYFYHCKQSRIRRLVPFIFSHNVMHVSNVSLRVSRFPGLLTPKCLFIVMITDGTQYAVKLRYYNSIKQGPKVRNVRY